MESDYKNRIAALSREHRALLENSLAGQRADKVKPIPRRLTADDLPLSFAQQRLWFLDRFESGNPFYHIPASVRLTGPVDPAVIDRAIHEIIRRHEVLRTIFPVVGGVPQQRIIPSLKIPIPLVDMRSLPPLQRPAQAHRWYEEEIQRPFDLGKGPLVRVALLQLGPIEHWVLFTFHHIVFDGWSISILENELRKLVAAFGAGLPSPLPDLPIQYGDFALWQRQTLTAERLKPLLDYWRLCLDGAPEAIDLPTDRPRPIMNSFRGARRGFIVPAAAIDPLRALVRHESATMFMVLCAAFQLLLHKYAGQEDIVIGTIIANRTRSELEPLVGFFVNSLVLRTNFSGDLTFREVLRRVKETTLGALAHQDLPFERLVEELRPNRHLSRNPLFQVAFVLQNLPGHIDASPEPLQSDAAALHSVGTSKFDLTLAMVEGTKHIRGAVEYNTDLYDAATIDRLVEHFCLLLENIAMDPDQMVHTISLITPSERRALHRFNEPEITASETWCSMRDLLKSEAVARPDLVAAEDELGSISFAELDARANQLSHQIMAMGLGAEHVIAVCLDRCIAAPVALFGILGAGAAALPLDPLLPKKRLDYMLRASEAHLLITHRTLLSSLPTLTCPILCLDDEETASTISKNPKTSTGVVIEPDQLAYVIFTSGSTGVPKGVMVPHRGIAELAQTAGQVFGHHIGSRVLQSASPSFDAWIFEILIMLGGHSTLVFASVADLMPGPDLTRLLRQRQVTRAILTPSTFSTMEADNLPDLDTVIFAAEASSRELASRWSRGRKLFNAYGPTECTIVALLGPCTGDRIPPLGRPALGTKIYVLDRYLNPSPPGCVGQIYVGGHGLARGYIGKASQTADRFIPNPFSAEPGSRLYRTGDLARFTHNGELQFVGRDDDQVKLRGFRIELGEIQARLLEHTTVQQAVIVVRRDLGSGPRLVAYVVSRSTAPSAAELRIHLREHLPGYMIPSAFVFLAVMPLNSSGKVAKGALPPPERLRVEGSEAGDLPRNSVEERIAVVWGEVLGLESVMVHDNFFDIGGHSLLATQVLARLTDMFRIEIPLRRFFLDPTISGVAAAIEEIKLEPPGILPPPLVPQPRQASIPLSFAQERLWFLDRFEPGSAFYNIPAIMRVYGSVDLRALSSAFRELSRRHEVLRTVFDAEDGRPVQRILPEADVPISHYNLLQLPESERELEASRLVAEEARRPFDLIQGPLFRVTIIDLSMERHILLVNLHHIIADGWSMGIVLRELNTLYMAAVTGQQHKLAPLSLQYADFAIWQRKWLTGDVLALQLSWWRARLQGAPPVINLPVDRPRPATQLFRGATYRFAIPSSLAESICSLANLEQVTVFMVLLASFSVLLYRYSGQSDLVIGTPIANRVRPELENLVGLFVNTLALRCDLSERPSFRELLLRIRETTLGAYAHQDMPFERLVEILQPERNLGYNPLFQVMFAYQNIPGLAEKNSGADWRQPDEPLREMGTGNGTAKFDLTLFLGEASASLTGAIEYNTDIFDAERIMRMAQHFQKLLSEIVEAPDTPIDDLLLLEPSDRREMTINWNDTRVDRPTLLAHELFERQAQAIPHGIALELDGNQLTYSELNGLANVLSWELRSRGVWPETPVAIVCERSFEALIGIFGVWKAGGAYLPVDPENPSTRIEQILSDADIRVVLTSRKLLSHLPSLPDVTTLCLDDQFRDGRFMDPLPALVGPQNLAYIIYTSGSTGRPKGVLTEHAPLANRLLWMIENHPIGPGEVVVQKTPLHFDVSVWEYLWPLSAGAKLVLAEHGGHRDPQYLVRLVADCRATAIHFVPSMLPAFLEQPDLQRCTALKRIYCSGEELSKKTADDVLEKLPVELHNMYGPTEAAIEVSHWACRREDSSTIVPIGYPLWNTRLYVLDDHLQPMPIGIPGELYIGGLPIARGYHGQGALTAERFVPDPFGKPGTRMYKSGDRVRFRNDRSIEFLGRLDGQVKIRGFRIETGEIEGQILLNPSVSEVVVTLQEVSENDKRLVAYVVPRAEQDSTSSLIEDLRRDLAAVLPEYMIPSAFVFLKTMPRGSTGKINRNALPKPERSTRTEFQGPRTQAEVRVAAIWSQVLHIRQIDVRDRFFDIGGHSLLATQVIARVNKAFNINLPLRKLFETPRLAEFSAAAAEAEILAVGPRIQSITMQGLRNEADLLKRIDTMSDDEVASLLAELSSEEDTP